MHLDLLDQSWIMECSHHKQELEQSDSGMFVCNLGWRGTLVYIFGLLLLIYLKRSCVLCITGSFPN
jgi:hypothetical protein